MAAFLPFHIDRGEGQMMTSNFFLAPLFLCLFYDLIYCQKADVYSKKYIVLVCLAPFIDIRISVMAVLLFIVFLLQLHDWDYTKRIAWYPVLLFFYRTCRYHIASHGHIGYRVGKGRRDENSGPDYADAVPYKRQAQRHETRV